MFTGHHNFDHATARRAFHFDKSQFVLGFLQIVLHGLGLLHQASELTFVEHGFPSVKFKK
jgi:hypothetical protein